MEIREDTTKNDYLKIHGKEFTSRLMLGTGNYKTFSDT